MSKKDKEIQKIGILKFWLGIAVGTILAIIGWSATSYKDAELFLLVIASFVVLCLFVAVIYISKRLNKKINNLEDL